MRERGVGRDRGRERKRVRERWRERVCVNEGKRERQGEREGVTFSVSCSSLFSFFWHTGIFASLAGGSHGMSLTDRQTA